MKQHIFVFTDDMDITFCEVHIQVFCPLSYRNRSFLCILDVKSFVRYTYYKYLLPLYGLSFHFLNILINKTFIFIAV